MCVVVSRLSVWIDGQGEIEARTEAIPGGPNMPLMQVWGRRFLFDLE
jgi:hypothetical protein